MKAVRFHRFGGPEVLRHEDVEPPVPGAGQVRVRVSATSFTGVDAVLRAGGLPGPSPLRLPHVPGLEVAGTIDAFGTGVDGDQDGLRVGDAVVALLPVDADGGSAEYAIAPAQALAGVPRRIPPAEVACLPLAGLTAWQALFDHGRLSAGQHVLVHDAGGAAGGYAVQLAAQARAHVSTRPGECSAPVDLVVNLAPATAPRLAALLPLVRDGGRLVNTGVGPPGGAPAPSDARRGVQGLDVSVRSDADQLADLVARVCTGELRLDVPRRVALADLPAVHARAAAGTVPWTSPVTVVVVAHPA